MLNSQTTPYCARQPKYGNKCGSFLLDQIPPGDFKIVFEHDFKIGKLEDWKIKRLKGWGGWKAGKVFGIGVINLPTDPAQ